MWEQMKFNDKLMAIKIVADAPKLSTHIEIEIKGAWGDEKAFGWCVLGEEVLKCCSIEIRDKKRPTFETINN